ncbi:MAG TPA: nuclear transport factor 2 family protein [Acidimicrobiales bacterium]|nr:nuclear transport factor 2 family protein [Acidimicrobiales bacterium]
MTGYSAISRSIGPYRTGAAAHLLYCWAVDDLRLDDLAAVFTEDCTFDRDHGEVIQGRLALIYFLIHRLLDIYSAITHHLANVWLDVDGDQARSRSYVHAFHRFRVGGTVAERWGTYENDLVRSGEGWRIAHRRLRAHGTKGFPEGAFEFRERA